MSPEAKQKPWVVLLELAAEVSSSQSLCDLVSHFRLLSPLPSIYFYFCPGHCVLGGCLLAWRLVPSLSMHGLTMTACALA